MIEADERQTPPVADTEFRDLRITRVRRETQGYSITTDDGFSLFVEDVGIEPKIGQTARLYGQGFGSIVRGIVIDGQVVRYVTPEQQAQKDAVWLAEQQINEAAAKAEAERNPPKVLKQDAPWPESREELEQYLTALLADVDGRKESVGYEYSTEAAWKGTVACFNWFSHEMGLTGFQAGWCALQIVKAIQGIKGSFGLREYENLLYPQYLNNFTTITPDTAKWLREQAQKKLTEARDAHPEVITWWRKLASGWTPLPVRDD